MLKIGEVRKAFRNKVYFTTHAVERMVERKITPDNLRKLLRNPSCWAEYKKHPGTLRIDGYVEKKGCCGFVVAIDKDIETGESMAVVITVMDKVDLQKRVQIAKENLREMIS